MKCFGLGHAMKDDDPPDRWMGQHDIASTNKPPRHPSHSPSAKPRSSLKLEPSSRKCSTSPSQNGGVIQRMFFSSPGAPEQQPRTHPAVSSPSPRKTKTFPGPSPAGRAPRDDSQDDSVQAGSRKSFNRSASSSQSVAKASGSFSSRITQALNAPAAALNLSMERKSMGCEEVPEDDMLLLEELQRNSDLRHFTYGELRAATKNFSKDLQLGSGGFGRVYKGMIKSNSIDELGESRRVPREVAVKRLDSKSLQGHKEWMMELSVLATIEHPNLVKLFGFCADGERRLLVYEYLCNSSLDRFLFKTTKPPLDWATRLKVALGTARGLMHLHEDLNPPIIFRDFKTSNVLLDGDFNAKLSDFGLAREGSLGEDAHVSTQVRGTAGYAAPEYMMTGHLTPKNDVWSFGVVLLELLTGRQSIDGNRPKHESNLVQFSRAYLQDVNDILKIMDPRLEGKFQPRAAAKVAEIAKWCLHQNPVSRPIMNEVVQVLTFLSTPEWTSIQE